MTRQEKRLLAIGIVSGALIAGAVGLGLFYRFQNKHAPETTIQAPLASEVAAPAAAAAAGDMQGAVHLSRKNRQRSQSKPPRFTGNPSRRTSEPLAGSKNRKPRSQP